jgi:hypothetical protein
MATKLTKPISRELMDGTIVTLHPDGRISFREKKKKTKYYVSVMRVKMMAIYETLWDEWKEKKKKYEIGKSMGKRMRKVRKPSWEMFSKKIRQIYTIKK